MARKLLLADDSITIQKVVELVLSEEDFQIKAVNNGNEALSILESYRPDIVLADIEMPEVNGYQLCDRIKKNPVTGDTSVILLAGAFEPLDEELAKNVGADDFIIKPFESQELISKINAVLLSAGEAEPAVEAEVSAVTEEGDFEAAVVAEETEEVAYDTMAETSVETVEGAAEDIWSMEAEAVEDESTDIWELDETSSIDADEVEAIAVGKHSPETDEDVATVEGNSIVGEDVTPAELAQIAEPVFAEEAVSEDRFEPSAAEPPVAEEPVRSPEDFRTAGPSAAVPEVKLPSEDELKKIVQESIDSRIETIIEKVDVGSMVSEAITPVINSSIEKIMNEMIPSLIQKSVNELLLDTLSPLNKQIENIIWETIPDLAENLIKKEIEKIKSEF